MAGAPGGRSATGTGPSSPSAIAVTHSHHQQNGVEPAQVVTGTTGGGVQVYLHLHLVTPTDRRRADTLTDWR